MCKRTEEILMDISRTITNTLKDFNNRYHETNPVGSILTALEDKGLKVTTEFPVPHVDYGKNEKVNLIVEDHPNKVLVNLYRMDSGRYEVNAYEAVMLKETPKKRNKSTP